MVYAHPLLSPSYIQLARSHADREHTKDSKRRELDFANELAAIRQILDNLQNQNGGGQSISAPRGFQPGSQLAHWVTSWQWDAAGTDGPDRPTKRQKLSLAEVAANFSHDGSRIDPRSSLADGIPLELLASLRDHVSGTGFQNSLAIFSSMDFDIIVGLRKVIWARDWTLDPSMRTMLANDKMRDATRIITRALTFSDFQARGDGIAMPVSASTNDEIIQTYSWIYNRGPPSNVNGLLEWTSFPDWLECPSERSYWITGKPGSGKSTMMKYILSDQTRPTLLSHLGKWTGPASEAVITNYYAWSPGSELLQRSLQGLKRTMLFQVLHQRPQLLPDLLPRRWALLYILPSISVSELRPLEDWELDEAFGALLVKSQGRDIHLMAFIDGLDEFDEDPMPVISAVQEILSHGGGGVKLCVASRPWPEFQDAYGSSSRKGSKPPMISMDLLTRNDMKTFVDNAFRGCKAFDELRAINGPEANQLLKDLIRRANGVFVWLKVVVTALTASATLGSGITELRLMLDSLPPELSSLYKTIWGQIPDSARTQGATLLRLVEALHNLWSMEYTTAFLAHEYCLQPYAVGKDHPRGAANSADARAATKLSLKRKLAASTRGLLEVQDSGDSCIVSFAHRTAYEWATEVETQKIIVEQCRPRFDPYLLLLEIYVFQVSWELHQGHQDDAREVVIRPLRCESKVGDQHPENVDAPVRALDNLDRCLEGSSIPSGGPGTISGYFKRCSWACDWKWCDWPTRGAMKPELARRQTTFLAMTAQFGILPYLKAKSEADRRILYQGGAYGVAGILESCIFATSTRELSLRLQTVKFLRSMGVEQVNFYLWSKKRGSGRPYGVREQVTIEGREAEKDGDEELRDYYKEVARILGPDGLGPRLRMGLLRLRLVGYKGVDG